MSNKTLIIAEDDESIRLVTSRYLQDLGYEVILASNLKELWKLIESNKGDALITDVMLPDGELFDILPQIIEYRESLPVIVVSAKNNLQTAISATKQGAYEYLPKPFDLDELQKLVKKALESKQNSKNKTKLKNESEKQLIVGRSPSMQELYKSIARLSQNDLTVMIYGESGTGKELVAKALHKYSARSEKPFIALNMAAIPNDLIESELFGHEKGSFTGAHQKSDGKFKLAEKGTLFLDEIGDMPIDAQTRLLRVLQEGEFTPIGGKEKILADTRIIAATHKNLSSLIEKGEFREDLFYRLNVVPINIPPLRERKEDIPELVNHFLEKAKTLKLEPKKFNTESFQILEKYQWPGNVRELENFILKLCALYADEIIMNEDLVKEIKNLQKLDQQMLDTDSQFSKILENYLSKNINKINTEYQGDVYNYFVTELEKVLLFEVLKNKNGNQLKAAELLGLNRNTLRKKITELNISID
ncbi:MAG: nitrogen regulation protein NR(I) [Pseudomonadota bacterium]|jgi:two-component system nitrogen regulation response regulator GlnG|nr:nitrogen regulation protein NR(I) [Pseudomonadota bacterium]MED5273254.1 nitrogen regulation protein NR(I) [Pseudomonadota bacterium]|tara:strand:- start:1203 stop:2627 length:1425 start_codon:yes stop_codon:yes gene_type:complete